MPRQLDKLNPHMHKEARIGIQNYDNGYTQEELDEMMAQLNGTAERDVLQINLGKVCKKFVFEHNYLSAIMGPVGSGKSTGSILKILLYAMSIMPGKDGLRKSRWLVVRNTKPELKNTTIKTFLEWMRPFGRFESSKMTFFMDFDDVSAEIQFLALDDKKDLGKLLSLECTGIYFNELSEIDREIYTRAQQRIGRYPSLKATGTKAWFDLRKCKEYGIILDPEKQFEEHKVLLRGKEQKIRMYKMDCIFSDTNPPLMGSYFQKMFEKQLFNEAGVDENPPDFRLYRQPSGMSPYAENKINLKSNYYEDIIRNSPKEVSDQMVHVQYGLGETGLGVYRSYFKEEHIKKHLTNKINKSYRLIIGMDFGLTPACCICQIGEDGKLRVLDEIYATNTEKMHLKEFLDTKVEPFLQSKYSTFFRNKQNIIFAIDPAGLQRNQVSGETACQELQSRGYYVRTDSTNKLGERLQAVKEVFKRSKNGKDGVEYQFEIDEKCNWLITGFRGNYYYEKNKVSFANEPCKNEYSHIQDAFQYVCVHIEKYNDRYCLIDNTGGNLYNGNNERIIIDSKIGY